MYPLKRLTDIIIYGNFLIAACAAALIWESYAIFQLRAQPLYILLGFCATLFVYNADRLVVLESLAGLKSERHIWIVGHARLMVVYTILAGIGMAVAAFFLNWPTLLFLGHLGALSIFYSVPILPRNGGLVTLRSLPSLKIFLITYVWVASTVWLPAVSAGISLLDKNVSLLAVERALFIFGITLPFDIRDYRSDKLHGVYTLPGLMGIRWARILAVTCLLACGMVDLLHYTPGTGIYWAKLLAVGITLPAVYLLNENSHEYYFTGLLDGTLLLQAMLVALLAL